MNLLVYLRFLRPVRSLVGVAIYTAVAGNCGRYVLKLDPGTAWFIALAVALPLLLGILIAGAAHEPMHRPFAQILPNIRQRQRNAATASVLIGALAATCAATWAAPAVAPVATFGLACALIALPCIDRHQLLGNQAAPMAAFLGWLFAGKALGPNLARAMNATPGLFLLGGLAVGVASLTRGFSRASLRARAHTLFLAYPTGAFSLLFHRDMMANWQAEVIAHSRRQGKGSAAVGRDWSGRSVGATSLDWMRVFWHANFGARPRGSFLRVQSTFVIMTLAYAVIMPGALKLMGQAEFWPTLAQLSGPDPKSFPAAKNSAALCLLVQSFTAVACVCLVFRPQLAYPVSRARLARVVFGLAAAQWAVALVLPAATIFLVSLAGQAVTGRFLPGLGVPGLLAVDLPLAVLLPLLVAAGTLRRPVQRILAAVPIGMALMLLAFARPHFVLTLPGLLGGLGATTASLWLLWHRLRGQYATIDLLNVPGFPRPMGLAPAGQP